MYTITMGSRGPNSIGVYRRQVFELSPRNGETFRACWYRQYSHEYDVWRFPECVVHTNPDTGVETEINVDFMCATKQEHSPTCPTNTDTLQA